MITLINTAVKLCVQEQEYISMRTHSMQNLPIPFIVPISFNEGLVKKCKKVH